MIKIEEYILLSLDARQSHLKIDEPCIERGVNPQFYSTEMRALLAHILDTTIPLGLKIHVCHACNNRKCSNPNHLYWGTPKENRADRSKYDNRKMYELVVNKYGKEKAAELCRIAGSRGGKGNKGKKKAEEHKLKIAYSVAQRHREGIYQNSSE